MKYATYLATYTLCLAIGLTATYAQQPDMKKFEYFGSAQSSDGPVDFHIDLKRASRDAGMIVFTGIATNGSPTHMLDKEGYSVTDFVANCQTYQSKKLRVYTVFEGEETETKYIKGKFTDSPSGSIIFRVVQQICAKGMLVQAE